MAEEQKGFEDTLKDITTDLKRILTNRIVVLKGAYERDIIYYKTMITSHEVTIGQQSIQLKKAQETVEDNVQTILRLQAELSTEGLANESLLNQCGILQEKNNSLHEMVNAFKGITPYATNMRVIRKADGTIPIDIHSGVVEQEDNPFPGSFVPVRTIPTDEYSVYLASGRGMVEYPFNPEGEKEPYPYTHPIREIGTSGRIKVKK